MGPTRATVPGTALQVTFDDLADGGTVRIANTRDGSSMTMWRGDWETLVERARKIRGSAEPVDQLPDEDRPRYPAFTFELETLAPVDSRWRRVDYMWRPTVDLGAYLQRFAILDLAGQPIVRMPFSVHDSDFRTVHTICSQNDPHDIRRVTL